MWRRLLTIVIAVLLIINIIGPSHGSSMVTEANYTHSSGLSSEEKKRQMGKIDFIRVVSGNLRARPTTKSSIVDKLKRGDKVTILQKKDEWYIIKLQNGRFGWAHQSLFQEKQSTTGSKKTPLTQVEEKASSYEASSRPSVKVKDRLTVKVYIGNIRARPSLSSKIISKLKRGDAVFLQETKGDWYFVKLKDDQFGWGHESLFYESYAYDKKIEVTVNRKVEVAVNKNTEVTPKKETEVATKKEKKVSPWFIQEIKGIKPEISSEGKERVDFIITGYNPPQVFIINDVNPRVVCDFLDTRLENGISRRIKVNGDLIQQIRIALYKGFSPKVRVVLDLIPGPDYKVETTLLDKRYSLIVKRK